MPEGNLRSTLRLLSENRVDFILVGGLAAVLQGVPVSTFDVDIVHSREASNIQRLLAVLETLDAIFRMQPESVGEFLHSSSVHFVKAYGREEFGSLGGQFSLLRIGGRNIDG